MTYELRVNGEISISPCTTVSRASRRILIMGATGSGKSSFIEALAGKPLDIVRDQLSGFTQEVIPYELQGAGYAAGPDDDDPWPIYLIDTPGFSDSKISEWEIVNKVRGFIEHHGVGGISHVLYMYPITDTRVPGNKFRTVKMLKTLLHDGGAGITIVTTMWNRVKSAQATQRAESQFAMHRDSLWKDAIDRGATITKFLNSRNSALTIVSDTIKNAQPYFPLSDGAIGPEHQSAPLLYLELFDRINNSRQVIEGLRFDYIGLIAHPDPDLESVIARMLIEAEQNLARFLTQLMAFGAPPSVFAGVTESEIYRTILDDFDSARKERQALELALSELQDRDVDRKLTLEVQLKDAETRIIQHSWKVIEYGTPPPGFEQRLWCIYVENNP